MRLHLSLMAAMGISALLPAQGFQCSLVGTYNDHGPFNDIWGFVGSNGKEYALLGTTTGTVVLDCSNPANPIERGWFPWQSILWRDIRFYQDHAYIVTEEDTNAGLQVLDLTNPDAPTEVGIFTGGGLEDAHNVCIDTGTGLLYLPGSNLGTPVYDLSTPSNPVYVGIAAGTGAYNHDLCVQNGYGYASMIYAGNLRIWDVSTIPATVLSDAPTPSLFTHNAWPNAAGTVCVTTDERDGGHLRFFDITNKSAPVVLSQVNTGPGPGSGATPHNAFIHGDYCHVAWYGEGYVCFDIKDPSTPVKVASYDTHPDTVGFPGAWGCYPFQPSGNIYISDQQTGLYIVRPHLTDLEIAHAPLTDSADELDPYAVTATITTSHTLQSATLAYRVGTTGPFTSVTMAPTGNPDEFTANIPAQDAPTVLEYHIDAVDDQAARRTPRIGENRFLVGTETEHWLDDFEVDIGWTNGGSGNQWQRGAPFGKASSSQDIGYSDPPLAFSGTTVWGNDLGYGNFNGAYPPGANNYLESPPIPTNGVQGLMLGYRRHLSLADGDSARVLVNGTVVASFSTRIDDTFWFAAEHDIAAIADTASTLVIRFELESNNNTIAAGWTLDDIRLFTRHDCVPPLHYGVGTTGTGAVIPQLTLTGDPLLGSTPLLDANQMIANSIAILAAGVAPADVPALGIQLLIDPVGSTLFTGLINAAGEASWPLPIPTTPSLDGAYLYFQGCALDAGSPAGFLSASRGMRIRICSSAP